MPTAPLPVSNNQVALASNLGDTNMYARVQSAATTNATVVKAAAGRIYTLALTNHDTSKCFFKLYDLASGLIVGTSIPIMTLCIPATTATSFQFPLGLRFNNGIAYAILGPTGQADSSTNPAALDQCAGGIIYT